MIPVSEADLLHDNGFWVVIEPKGKVKSSSSRTKGSRSRGSSRLRKGK